MTNKGTVMLETERLTIRKFKDADTPALYEIMQKPEVLYAWEHGFTFEETQEWLVRQQTRYQQNGFGYMAVLLKDTGVLIGQAGLLDNEIEGQPITEIGYIFDNAVWGNGYAIEANKALVYIAFEKFGIDKLYCTMRPENIPSIKVAERLGFRRISEYVKSYNGKEMRHLIYILEKQQWIEFACVGNIKQYRMVEIKESCLDEILALNIIHEEALRFFASIDPEPSVTTPKERITRGCLPPNGSFDNYHTVSLYINNEIIGYCDYYMGHPTDDTVYISTFYVAERYRNLGYSSSAIDLLYNQFISLGYRYARLRVSLTNWLGIRFWVRKGFVKITMVEAKTNYSKGVYGGIELEMSLEGTT